jgi:hypothetical protein
LDITASRRRRKSPTRTKREKTGSSARTPRSERSSSTSRTERSSTTSQTKPGSRQTRPQAPSLASRFSDETAAAAPRRSEGEEDKGGVFSRVIDNITSTLSEVRGSTDVDEAADTGTQGSEATETPKDEDRGGGIFDIVRDRAAEVAERAEARQAEEMQEAAEVYREWSQDPDGLATDLNGADLTELSNGERLALFQLTQEHDGVSGAANDALHDTFENIESFGDIPSDRGFQALLASGTNEELDERLSGLLSDELSSGLASRLEDASGDEEADRALDRFIGDIEGIARTRPGLAHLLEAEATSVLDGAGEDITDVRRADDNIFQKANHAVTGFARGAAGFVGDRLRDIGDIAGTALDTTLDFAGDLQEFTIDTAGALAGGAADLVGADGVADNIRDGAQALGDAVDSGYDFVGEQSGNFTRGFAEGAAGTVEGVTELAVNPVGTVQALGTLIKDPGLIVDSYKAIAEEHGVAGAIGAVGFDVVSTLAGGGGAAARVSSIAGRAATFLDDVGRVARVADNVGAVTDDIGRVASRTGTAVSGLADGGAVSRAVANASTSLADLGAGGLRNLGQAADTVGQFTQPLRNGVGQATDAVTAPLRRGAGAVAESALGQTVRNGIPRVVPDAIRHPVSRVRRGVNDLLTGDDSAEFAASSRAVRGENPQIDLNVENARTRFAELKTEFGELDGKALQREALERLIDPDGDIARYAREFDALSDGGAPGGVGDVLANSRVEALDYIRNSKTIDPDVARRILRGLVADGDPAGPAFLTQLRANDRVFRAFDSGRSADGGYVSRVSDSRFDATEQIRVSALPYDPERAAALNVAATDAAGGAIAAVGEDSVALVTRVAEQPGFGPRATGGGWQLQLFNDESLRNRLSEVRLGGGSLPEGVTVAEPGTTSAVQRFQAAAALRRRAEALNRISQSAGSLGLPIVAPQLDVLAELSNSEFGQR